VGATVAKGRNAGCPGRRFHLCAVADEDLVTAQPAIRVGEIAGNGYSSPPLLPDGDSPLAFLRTVARSTSPGNVPMKLPWLLNSGLILLGLTAAGCHDLQPHRLQRLNRGPGMGSDAYYSVPDPQEASGAALSGWDHPPEHGGRE
jgi:hypothetical protein